MSPPKDISKAEQVGGSCLTLFMNLKSQEERRTQLMNLLFIVDQHENGKPRLEGGHVFVRVIPLTTVQIIKTAIGRQP